MKKRFLSVLLVLCMSISLLTGVSFAAEIVSSGKCGDNLTWELTSDGILTIAGTGTMYDWYSSTYTNVPWYSFRYQVKSVVVEDGVESIGGYAFYQHYNLESVSIGGTVKEIGQWSFVQTDISKITIPRSVEYIGPAVFHYCDKLTDVYFESSLKISAGSFDMCQSIARVHIPTIEDWCKMEIGGVNTSPLEYGDLYVDNLLTTDVIIPSTVETISFSLFAGYKNLHSVTIPASVKCIDSQAFCDCVGLIDVYYIGTEAQWNEITIDENGNSCLTDATIHYITQTSIPCADPASGEVESGTVVSLSADDEALIYYSTDGSVPTILYTAPIEITEDTTIKAYAVKEGLVDSDTTTFYYTVSQPETSVIQTYTVSYDVNGGSGTITAQTKIHDVDLVLSSAVPTKSGYTFANWLATDGTTYAPGVSYSVNESTTLIAQWNANTYAISYNANGGSAAPSTQTKTHGISLALSSSAPVRDGYTFKGWATTSTGSVAYAPGATYSTNANITLYAVWETIVETTIVASGVCGVDLTWTLDDVGTLTISGTGAMADNVVWGPSYAQAVNGSVKAIVIEPGATSIGARAFSSFSSLSSVTIANTVLTIGASAFWNCTSLSTVALPNSVTYIGLRAFSDCTALSSIVIPASVNKIESDSEPNYYGDSYTYLFDGCSSLTKIMVDPNNAVYSSLDGNLYNKDQTILLRYAPGKTDASFVVPDTVTEVYDSAFKNCSTLTKVTLPKNLTMIDRYAFFDCTSLESINIPERVSEIPYGAFQNCALTQVKFPESVTSIKHYAFAGCENLTTLIVPYTLTSISSLAFDECTTRQTVYYTGSETEWEKIYGYFISPSVKYVDPSGSCGDGLTWLFDRSESKLIISGTGAMPNYSQDNPAPWYPFRSDIKEILIQNGATSIGDYAFYYCAGSSVSIPSSVTAIGKYAFSNSGLTSVNVPDNVTTIGEHAFDLCANLTSADLGESLGKLENSLFRHCTSLTSVSVPDSVTSIGASAFYYCIALNQITLPKNLTEIGSYAFYTCAFTDISLPNKVTAIGDFAFAASGVKSIFIPKAVITIGQSAFESSSLTDVYYGGTNFDWTGISIDTNNSKLLNATFHYVEQVPAPTASVASGEVESGTEITLTAEDGVTIYYSVDGSDPTNIYSAPIVITEDTTIKAFATKTGLLDSDVVTFTYTVKQTGDTPDTPAQPDEPIVPVDAPTLTFGDMQAKSGGTVVVPLAISNNPGLVGLSILVSYDSVLTLTGLEVGEALTALAFTNPKTLTANPLKLLWDGVDADASNGNILYLTFAVAEGAEESDYSISATYDAGDIYDGDMNDVDVAIVAGKVTVKNSTPGDVNDDGIINGKDVTLIRRHILGGYEQIINEDAADVNKDGIINGKDVTLIRRYILGGYGVELK